MSRVLYGQLMVVLVRLDGFYWIKLKIVALPFIGYGLICGYLGKVIS